uniref:Uncharacterized protein n=1 Tax=Heterorhabditis bacteriophora TaxID=37862 RepID=A0A1I7WBG8_HETBA
MILLDYNRNTIVVLTFEKQCIACNLGFFLKFFVAYISAQKILAFHPISRDRSHICKYLGLKPFNSVHYIYPRKISLETFKVYEWGDTYNQTWNEHNYVQINYPFFCHILKSINVYLLRKALFLPYGLSGEGAKIFMNDGCAELTLVVFHGASVFYLNCAKNIDLEDRYINKIFHEQNFG